jgi:hypothetical protein
MAVSRPLKTNEVVLESEINMIANFNDWCMDWHWVIVEDENSKELESSSDEAMESSKS